MSIAAIVILVVILLVPTRLSAQSNSEVYEQEFVILINNLRASSSLSPLSVNGNLVSSSRTWAEHMSSVGAISHDPNLRYAVSDFMLLGENVGTGPSVQTIYNAFVNSPGHYANMVNPSFAQIGVGVVANNGVIYTAQRFLQPVGSAVAPPAPTVAPVTEPSATLAPTTTAAPTTSVTTTINPVCVATPVK